jgi:helicase
MDNHCEMDWEAVLFGSEKDFNSLVRRIPEKNRLEISPYSGEEILSTIHMTLTEDFRPFRCQVSSQGTDTCLQPKRLMDLVGRSGEVVFASDEATRSVSAELEDLFRRSRTSWRGPCPLCIREGRVRFPGQPVEFGRLGVCLECAENHLAKEAKAKGFSISRPIRVYLRRVLTRNRSYDDAYRVLSADYKPASDRELTIFDTVESQQDTGEAMPLEEVEKGLPEGEFAGAFIEMLRGRGIEVLLPVQARAMRAGLLHGEDLLIVSQTSSGKTLIAEMAGAPMAKRGRKFLYLTPLVALANLRYTEFDEKYGPLGLRVAIRVGTGRIRDGGAKALNSDVASADLVVGTYEGIEQMLRSGKGRIFYETGVVAIDEVQNLVDEDRGSRLDGLIKKIKVLCPRAQMLYLSATVGNPSGLARKLGASLVSHQERAVPLERHIMPITAPGQKIRLIRQLIELEFSSKSVHGYRGQTLVFTNSRRKCHELASELTSRSAPVRAYHSGLSYQERRGIEDEFLRQRIGALITTAALAAGVDLPASQVVFETMAMGREWITPGEFHQMAGRAGRLGFHESGKVVLMIEPGKNPSPGDSRDEDRVAMDLLEARVSDVEPEYSHEDNTEQILADISTFGVLSKSELGRLQDYSIGFSSSMKPIVDSLAEGGFIDSKPDSYTITPLGRITSSFFLSLSEAELIRESISEDQPPLEILVQISSFERAYLSQKLQKQILHSMGRRASAMFFNSDALELLANPRKVSTRWLSEVIGNISRDLLQCSCRSSPYCACPSRKLSRQIIRLRTSGKSPGEISRSIFDRYGIEAYPGDVTEYLNDAVRLAEATHGFCKVLDRPDLAKRSQDLMSKIIG